MFIPNYSAQLNMVQGGSCRLQSLQCPSFPSIHATPQYNAPMAINGARTAAIPKTIQTNVKYHTFGFRSENEGMIMYRRALQANTPPVPIATKAPQRRTPPMRTRSPACLNGLGMVSESWPTYATPPHLSLKYSACGAGSRHSPRRH